MRSTSSRPRRTHPHEGDIPRAGCRAVEQDWAPGHSTGSNDTPTRWAKACPRSNPTPFISPDAVSRMTPKGLPSTSPTRSVPVGANACRTSGVGAAGQAHTARQLQSQDRRYQPVSGGVRRPPLPSPVALGRAARRGKTLTTVASRETEAPATSRA